MASPGSNPSPRPPHASRPSVVQVAASALAAVSAALISSTFGVAGTLIGTAIASVFATVGSTLYLASMRRTNERLRRVAVAARRTDWAGALPTRPGRPVTPPAPVAEPELPFPVMLDDADDSPAPEPAGWSRLRWSNLRQGLPAVRRRWVAVAGLCVLIFVIAIAVLTGIQASTSQRLTAFPATSNSGHQPAPATSPTPAATPSAKPSASPTTAPSSSPSPTATGSPSATPTAGPSSPAGATPSPSASPTGAAASPSPSAETVP